MAIKESILPELEQELATTRKLLALVPESEARWKPHPKSRSLGELASHLADLPVWGLMAMGQTEMDLNLAGGGGFKTPRFTTTQATLDAFDENVRKFRESVAAASDQDLMVPWTLTNGGQKMFTMPRAAVLRSFVTSHLIHHRGQLSVYLRLRDVPLPSIYGPTADAAL